MDRDCGLTCPYAEHAPASAEAAACWSAAMACIAPGKTTLEMDMAGALAAARECGVSGWPAVEMLAAIGAGMAAGCAKRRDETIDEGETVNG